MSARACVCVMLVALCSRWAAAQHVPGGAGPSGDIAPADACPQAPAQNFSWLDREKLIRQHGELPSNCLKALVRECGRASETAMLDAEQAMSCSIRYEALLRHGFAGSFDALLEWWRAGR